MSASDRQVGGEHYKAEYQHWDWCIDLNIGYLEAAASKYVSRWHKKNGVQDLEKAIHYLEKAQEGFVQTSIWPWGSRRHRNRSYYHVPGNEDMCARKTHEFCTSAELGVLETELMYLVMTWREAQQLDTAIVIIRELIRKAQDAAGGAAGAGAALVPATPSPLVLDSLRPVPGRGAWGSMLPPTASTSSERLKHAFEQLLVKLRG